MVGHKSDGRDNRMRSAEFDREKVLRAAIVAFATKGFSQTSMQDLKQATGLHPGSIYCAFENKQGLLLAALEQYNKDKAADFQQLFEGQEKLLDGIRQYLDNTVNECALDGYQRVCLSQKALSEMAQVDPVIEDAVANNLDTWLNGFTQVFEQALERNEVDNSRSPLQRAQSLVMGIYGLRTYANTHAQPDVMKSLAKQLFDDVCR